jgi:Flp pilus assembly protein TadG
MLSLEAVAMLPILALLLFALLETAGVLRDVLLVHEASRAGARAAATSSGTEPVAAAARAAAPELTVQVSVEPAVRRDGDLATVRVSADRRVGPVTHRFAASAVARVEPAVGTTPRPGVPP